MRCAYLKHAKSLHPFDPISSSHFIISSLLLWVLLLWFFCATLLFRWLSEARKSRIIDRYLRSRLVLIVTVLVSVGSKWCIRGLCSSARALTRNSSVLLGASIDGGAAALSGCTVTCRWFLEAWVVANSNWQSFVQIVSKIYWASKFKFWLLLYMVSYLLTYSLWPPVVYWGALANSFWIFLLLLVPTLALAVFRWLLAMTCWPMFALLSFLSSCMSWRFLEDALPPIRSDATAAWAGILPGNGAFLSSYICCCLSCWVLPSFLRIQSNWPSFV